MSEARPSGVTAAEITPERESVRTWTFLGALVIGYIGIYLCRKNFAVANPLIREAFGLNKEQIGEVASYSTFAYMAGKFVFGPLIDRVGGRGAFLLALLGVALFGALGGLVNSLPLLILVYSMNRLAGSAGWGGMVKQVPNWFSDRSMAFAMGVLSMGFVFGGIGATLLAGFIANLSNNNWRWIMSGPSLVLIFILLLCWVLLPRERSQSNSDQERAQSADLKGLTFRRVADLIVVRRFWIVCALSFTLTLLRETFNTWTVDFFKTTGGANMSNQIAAFLSTPFDAFGAVGILCLGWVFGRLGPIRRMGLLFAILSGLAALILLLPNLASQSVWLATAGVAGIGFLSYGPYSLLAGVLAVEVRGKDHVATAAGIFDGVGYFAAILSGQQFGRILDVGGYRLAFNCLAILAAVAAVLCLFLYEWAPQRDLAPTVEAKQISVT
jgi:sugar phosphate permease